MDKILGCKEPYKGDLEKRFEFVKSFGSGGFGTVELCRDRDNGNKLVIRKLSHLESTTINEIAMLYHIRHKYIIKLYDYFQTKIDQETIDRNGIKGMKANTPMYGMVIEFGEGGDLLRYISERLSIEEIILLKIIDQSTQALQFLNENRTMHRDIKPENILLDKYGDIKLADFGTGDVLQEDSSYRTFTQQTGTNIYMAPEIKAQHKYYTYAIDIYSLGVSIYRACRGNIQSTDLKTIDVDGLPEPIPVQYSSQFVSLIKKMLEFDENDRATPKYILKAIQSITTPTKLSDSDNDLLKSSINLFYGLDGVYNKKEAVRNFQNLVTSTNYGCAESDFHLAQCYLYGDTVTRNNEEAIKLLRMASLKLHSPSLRSLSFCYKKGIGVEKDIFTSIQLLTIAQKKDQESGFLLGDLFFNGEEIDLKTNKIDHKINKIDLETDKDDSKTTEIDLKTDEIDLKTNKFDSKTVVKKDLELAFHYFYESRNFVPSKNYLGICYLNGKGVQSNPFEAYKYFSEAAKSGFLDSLYNLAIFYLDQKPNDQLYIEKATELLNEAAGQFHLKASFKLLEISQNKEIDSKKFGFFNESAAVFDSLYSFALLKLNGLKPGENWVEVEKNKYEAFSLFSQCTNHPGAIYRLAQCYRDGKGTEKDDKKSADLFEQASSMGIVDATVDLALCFLEGKGRPLNKEKAIELIKESIEKGSIYALNSMAKFYTEEDNEKAINLLRKAASENDLESIYNLAKCLRKKGLAEMDFDLLEEALELFHKAAKRGHSSACYEYGMIYSQGFEIYIDKEEASKFFQIASQQNHPQATTELGKYYENVKNEFQTAFKLYQKATNLGDKNGLYHLSLCYLKGVGVSIDKEKAKNLLEKAAEDGIVDAKVQLGFLYLNGVGCLKDEEKGAKLFEEASNSGNIEAKVQLGKCYLHGIGVNVDNKIAFRLFKQASDQKSVEGKYMLAKLYMKGIGTFKNPLDAILLFEYLVREKNYTPAMYQLGNCYLNGIGCDVDEKKGVQTLKKAVKNGNLKAMNLLALCYLNGTGVKKNTEAALEYLKKAADQGNKDAIENLKKYGKEDVKNTSQEMFNNQDEKLNNNKPLNKFQSTSSVYYMNDSFRLPSDSNTQKLPENNRFMRVQLKDQRSPRVNPRLGPVNNRQQKERNKPPEPIDGLQKSPRRVMIGPMPPILQKNRSGRRAINQPIQGQHRR